MADPNRYWASRKEAWPSATSSSTVPPNYASSAPIYPITSTYSAQGMEESSREGVNREDEGEGAELLKEEEKRRLEEAQRANAPVTIKKVKLVLTAPPPPEEDPHETPAMRLKKRMKRGNNSFPLLSSSPFFFDSEDEDYIAPKPSQSIAADKRRERQRLVEQAEISSSINYDAAYRYPKNAYTDLGTYKLKIFESVLFFCYKKRTKKRRDENKKKKVEAVKSCTSKFLLLT